MKLPKRAQPRVAEERCIFVYLLDSFVRIRVVLRCIAFLDEDVSMNI